MPSPRTRKPHAKITVPLPPDVAEAFYAYVAAHRQSGASAAVHLIELGLLAKEQGLDVDWRKPPRPSPPVERPA